MSNYLLSISAKKRFGQPCEFGFSRFGLSYFSYEFVGIPFDEFGVVVFAKSFFGNYFLCSGIYQTRHSAGSQITVREKYYFPSQPWSQARQDARDKFAAGVLAWQNLTDEQKEVYNERAERYRLPGYNLFLREYMKS